MRAAPRFPFCISVTIAVMMLSARMAVAMRVVPATNGQRVWQVSEFALFGIRETDNPYDPESIAVDVTFTAPSGEAVTVPAFWFQDYTRELLAPEQPDPGNERRRQSEKLCPTGKPGWRVRFTPLEPGRHRYRVVVTEEGTRTETAEGSFAVEPKPEDAHGFVRVEPQDKRHFMLDDGSPLPLLGECACWHGRRGTFDYDDWYGAFAKVGMNYSRLWMWPQAFGIEVLGDERLNYNQERAWRLDYVLELAARKGIYIMLCLDYHGIFQVEPDYWGGNNWWPQHPYNTSQGGPCRAQNEFFTNKAAKKLYRKRLRYLIGRYAAQPSLMSWEFFNEIDNVYNHLERSDVIAWHDETARWLRANDPYDHLITTSFSLATRSTGMWKLDSLDYAQEHCYLDGREEPARIMADAARRYRKRYGKPIYIGEFGVSWRGFKPEMDSYRRGLQQGLWGGILGGTAGTAMPWWWENIHQENLYPLWGSLARFLEGTGFGSAGWRPVRVSSKEDRLDVFGMTDGRTALVWAIDRRYHYPNGANAIPKQVAGAELTVHGLPDGDFLLQWWHTREGRVVYKNPAQVENGNVNLKIRPFAIDIAARVTRTTE